MSFDRFSHIPPVDGKLVDRIVCNLKSQGIFDQFRKDCLADVDTKPAYQNLQQRVNGTVASFLANHTWQEDLNKTQLRESLRRHVQQGFLEVGVDRIVEQVVNPKIITVFLPKVEDVVYDCLGVEKPARKPVLYPMFRSVPPPPIPPSSLKAETSQENSLSLLPQDLDPVSPGSVDFDTTDEQADTMNTSLQDVEPPAVKEDTSQNESQLSGISDLSSHSSLHLNEPPATESNTNTNTNKSNTISSKENISLQFENFSNLNEKIKKSEITHSPNTMNSVDQPEEESTEVKQENVDVKMETDDESKEEASILSQNTFEEFRSSTIVHSMKEEESSKTFSEDSRFSVSNNVKSIKSECVSDYESGSMPAEEELRKEINEEIVNEYGQSKLSPCKKENERSKEGKKKDEGNSRKHSESSSKHHRSHDSKHRSGHEKSSRDKEKSGVRSSRDDKPKSSSSKDKQREEKDRHGEKSKEKEASKSEYKEVSRSEHKEGNRGENKDGTRRDLKEHRTESKEDNRNENKDDSRKDHKEHKRSEYKEDNRNENKDDSKKDHKEHKRSENKDDNKREHKESTRNEHKEANRSENKDIRKDHKEHRRSENKEDNRREHKESSRSENKELSKREHKDASRSEHKEGSKSEHKEANRRDHKENSRREKEISRSENKEKETGKSEHKEASRREHKDERKEDKERSGKHEKDKCSRDKHSKDKDKQEKDKERHEKDKVKYKEDYGKEKFEKNVEEKHKEDKPRETEKTSHSSSSLNKKEDKHRSDDKEKSKRPSEGSSSKHRHSNDKSKAEEDKKESRERKRKGGSCSEEVKSKEARRSWDRDNGEGRGSGSHRSGEGERREGGETSGRKQEAGRTEPVSNESSGNSCSERLDGQVIEDQEVLAAEEEPSAVDMILMQIKKSIEEDTSIEEREKALAAETAARLYETDCREVQSPPLKKPKIAKNMSEIRKIMSARKNINRHNMRKHRRSEPVDDISQVEDRTEIESTSRALANLPSSDKNPEENKENIKEIPQCDSRNKSTVDVSHKLLAEQFTGFSDLDIEQSLESLRCFRTSWIGHCHRKGLSWSDSDLADIFLDWNEKYPTENKDALNNNLHIRSISRNCLDIESGDKRDIMELMMNGKNGCFVRLDKDCPQVAEAVLRIESENCLPPRGEQLSKASISPAGRMGADSVACADTLSLYPASDTASLNVQSAEAILDNLMKKSILTNDNDGKEESYDYAEENESNSINCDDWPEESIVEIIASVSTVDKTSAEELGSLEATTNHLGHEEESQLELDEEQSSTVINNRVAKRPALRVVERTTTRRAKKNHIIHNEEMEKEHSQSLGGYPKVNHFSHEEQSQLVDSNCDQVVEKYQPKKGKTQPKKMLRGKEEDTQQPTNVRTQRNFRASQRYDSSDLYKPRPIIARATTKRLSGKIGLAEDSPQETRGGFVEARATKRKSR